jgi:uncharacterized protein YcfL
MTPFVHGETLVAARLTQLAANLDAAHDRMGDASLNFPAANAIAGEDNDLAYMVHRYRWFWFKSSGTIVDPANAANTVTLTEDTEPTLMDLNSVSWLYPGKLYQITGVTWCMETTALVGVVDYYIRLESGDYLLLESGDRFLIEA